MFHLYFYILFWCIIFPHLYISVCLLALILFKYRFSSHLYVYGFHLVCILLYICYLETFSLRGALTFVARGLDSNGCVLSFQSNISNFEKLYFSSTICTLFKLVFISII